MNDFISTVRTDCKREMAEKEARGIAIANKNKYRLVDRIEITISDNVKNIYGFQANVEEIYFYIIDDDSNMYFTIEEIYCVLKILFDNGEDKMINAFLKAHIFKTKMNIDSSFIYRGVDYAFNLYDLDSIPEDKYIQLQDGAKRIPYRTFFLLLNLIQEKSNAFFNRGAKKNSKYTNGILRLLFCLLNKPMNVPELEELGWEYDLKNDRFYYSETEAKEKKKYYLTKQQCKSILKAES